MVPPPEHLSEEGGIKILRPTSVKVQFHEGIVASLGNVIPPEYQSLAIGSKVYFFHVSAIELTFERGVTHYLLRFADIWSEL